jgi:hypothetical protein
VHQQRLETVIGMMRKRNVRGPGLARCIEKRRVAQRTRIGRESLSPTRGMHITPKQRDAQLIGKRRDVLRVAVGIGAQVMVNMDRHYTPAG